MVELDGDAGLVDEEVDELPIFEEGGEDLLDDEDLLEAGHALGAGAPDLGHAAGGDLLQDNVAAPFLTPPWLQLRVAD